MNELFEHHLHDIEEHFSGWDFSYITESGRMDNGMLSWSYGSIVIPYIRKVTSMLDMGTGGGELLTKFQPLPSVTYATEGYAPNLPIAKQRLEPLGVAVKEVKEDNLLPFGDGAFDLIINKHEEYSPAEVRRVLTSDGIFVTQQVGGNDCVRINQALGAPVNEEYLNWNLEYASEELRREGFDVFECKEEEPYQRFYDIGALVYYLKAIPWQVPDFSIERYKDALYSIHETIQSVGFFEVKTHRFVMKAKLQKDC
ncbi:methyltransferase domain-containing protein [Bacillus sp. V3]|nr:methyltransferase domain-containing protein [Bacillus sp. V3]